MRRLVKGCAAAVCLAVVAASSAAAQVPADSAVKPAPDTSAKPTADSARRRAPPPRIVETVADTVLAGACPAGRGPADGLLLVTFSANAAPADRAAAAKHVGGTLLPRPGAAEGEYYIRLPAGGGEQQLQALADQLIRLAQVRMVGSAPCPPRLPHQAADTGVGRPARVP